MTSHLSIYVIINLKFSIVKLPKGIMAERSVLVKRELISNLPEARRSQRETIPYICDFSRCRLNVRLCARIQPLLRGHKYSVLSVFGCWSKIRINVGEFRDSSAGCNFLENKMLKIDTNYCYNAKARI